MNRERDKLLKRFGFEGIDTPTGLELKRHSVKFSLDGTFSGLSPDGDPRLWRRFAWSLWGARLVSDHVMSKHRVEEEGQEAVNPRNVYEIPSPYGARERLLVPKLLAESIEGALGKLAQEPWSDPQFTVLYALEEGLGTHLLTADEGERYPYPAEKLQERAKLTHFYNSYKMKPVKKLRHADRSVVKVYASSDGRTGSRVILFPDLDWDAAQDRGILFLLSRDAFVVGEPLGEEHAATTFHLTTMVVGSMLGIGYDAVLSSVSDPPEITNDFNELEDIVEQLTWGERQRDWFRQIPYANTQIPYWLTPESVVRGNNEEIDREPLPITLL